MVTAKYQGNKLSTVDINDGTYCIANINDMTDNMVNELSYETENTSAIEVADAENKLSSLNNMVFKYNNDATMLLPVYTKYEGNKLSTVDINYGTYCIANINDMTDNMVNKLSYETENTSAIEVTDAENKLSSLNLIYEICIDNNFKVPSWSDISSAIIGTNESLSSKGYNLKTTFIFTIYRYSVDISCNNISDLKSILSVVTSFFNDSSITNLNAAYNVYQKNRNEKLAVWKDFSNYYLANTNIVSKSNYSNNNIVFVINSGNQIDGRCCTFNAAGVRCYAYNAFFALYKRMFDNEIKNNLKGSPTDIMSSLALYVANINNKVAAKRTLFGKVLLNNNTDRNADSDSDGRADNNELNYLQKTTLGAVLGSSSILSKGKEQFQSVLNSKLLQPVELNDMEIVPEISDPARIDSDEDGINDSEDNAPQEKGIYNDDNKLVTGELTLLSCKGDSSLDIALGNANTGHTFLLYKSYINDVLDLSDFNSGFDFCTTDTTDRNYEPSDYSIEPDKYLAIGAGGFSLEDAQSVVYNMEFYKGYPYIPMHI